MRSFAIVIRRAYFEAKKHRNYARNVVVNSSANPTTFTMEKYNFENDIFLDKGNWFSHQIIIKRLFTLDNF